MMYVSMSESVVPNFLAASLAASKAGKIIALS
jgi:hypothetical protein